MAQTAVCNRHRSLDQQLCRWLLLSLDRLPSDELVMTQELLRETKVTERFTEHDLRAKCASDAESLEHARAMLAHADAKTTELIYHRRPERVRPAR
jgi:integrase